MAAGYEVRSLTVTPDRVELVGPAGVLRAIEVVRTAPVDLSAMREPAEFEVGLALKKGTITLARPTPLVVKADIEAVLEERRFISVPVVVRATAAWQVAPAVVTVTLRGPPEALGKVETEDVSVLVYVPDPQEGSTQEGPSEVRLGTYGLRFEVVHPGGDELTVGTVEPPVLHLTARTP